MYLLSLLSAERGAGPQLNAVAEGAIEATRVADIPRRGVAWRSSVESAHRCAGCSRVDVAIRPACSRTDREHF